MTGFLFLPRLAVDYSHVSANSSSLVLTALGVTNTLGRFLSGCLADFQSVNPIILFSLGLLGSTLCCALFPLVYEFSWIMLLSGGYGMFMAAYMCLMPTSAYELFGIENLNFVTGMFFFFFGIGNYLGPYLLGQLFELLHHDYQLTMLAAGATYAFAMILAFASFGFNKLNKDTPT